MDGGQQPMPEPDWFLRLLMSGVSRRGLFGLGGKLGLSALGAAALMKVGVAGPAVETAEALGCPECYGRCDCILSDCTPSGGSACDVTCACYCQRGCFGCIPVYFRAHMLWILGYIPNCTCPGCT
jgi:hypothetical protein